MEEIITITCRYCRFMIESSDRTGKADSHVRFCRPKDDYVSLQDVSCESFTPSDSNIFWCDDYACWMNFYACQSRQSKKLTTGTSSCNEKCSQAKVVRAIINLLTLTDTVMSTLPKRKLKRLKKREEKKADG